MVTKKTTGVTAINAAVAVKVANPTEFMVEANKIGNDIPWEIPLSTQNKRMVIGSMVVNARKIRQAVVIGHFQKPSWNRLCSLGLPEDVL